MLFIILLIIILVLILVILGIILYIYSRVRSTVGVEGLSVIKEAIRNNKELDKMNYQEEKSISGMTSILEPLIRNDFKDFNLELFYNNVEKTIRNNLECLEKKDPKLISKDMILIKGILKNKINDMKENKIDVSYSDIVFHKHALKDYYKKNGTATIVTNSSVGYYYKTNQKGKKQYHDVRKEIKYICEFVYVYDENKFDIHIKSFGIHCPNCGAPLDQLGNMNCPYCGSHVNEINLRNWLVANIKEIDTV